MKIDVLKLVQQWTMWYRVKCYSKVKEHCSYLTATFQQTEPIVRSFQQGSSSRLCPAWNIPVEIERLNGLVTGAAMPVGNNHMSWDAFWPLDFETSTDFNRCGTSSSVHNRLSMESGVVSGDTVLFWNIQGWEGFIEAIREKCIQHNISFVLISSHFDTIHRQCWNCGVTFIQVFHNFFFVHDVHVSILKNWSTFWIL